MLLLDAGQASGVKKPGLFPRHDFSRLVGELGVFGLLDFFVDMLALYLDPVISQEDFQCFFSVDGAWGTIKQRKAADAKVVTIEVLEGELDLEKIIVAGEEIAREVRLRSGERVDIEV